jgi:lactate dehydrogenase-like 2-hydroxyacid dehydrogenase
VSGRPSVLITRQWPAEAERYLQEHFDVDVNATDTPLTQDELCAAMSRYDALCPTVSDRITEQVIMTSPRRVRILANFGVGVDHIDLPACRRAGLQVTNTPGVLTECTADVAMMLMLTAARRAGEGERLIRSGRWTGWRPTQLLGTKVTGKILGLVGFGRIAQAVAARAHDGFGMQVFYYARNRVDAATEQRYAAQYCERIEDLLSRADFVSVHVPGGSATRHLIGAAQLGHMKQGACLVNTARGDVIDEDALVEALRSGRIASAGLDVYRDEPRVSEQLQTLENVVLLPHLGSATRETRVAMAMRAIANLEAFFAGRSPPDRIV